MQSIQPNRGGGGPIAAGLVTMGVLGMIGLIALALAVKGLAQTIEHQSFASSYSASEPTAYSVVDLGKGRFAVVHGSDDVSVFEVDAAGKARRLDRLARRSPMDDSGPEFEHDRDLARPARHK